MQEEEVEIQYFLNEKSRLKVMRKIMAEVRRNVNSGAIAVAHFQGLQVCREMRGLYLHHYCDGTYLGGSPVRIQELPVREVRLRNSGSDVKPGPEPGRYTLGGAVALVSRKVHRDDSLFVEDAKLLYNWEIEVVGSGHDSVAALYEAIFRGELDPWSSREGRETRPASPPYQMD